MSTHFFAQAGFLQFEIAYGDTSANLAKVKTLLHATDTSGKTLIVLPELWAYGFDYENAANHARQTSLLLHELTELAAERDIILAGSLLESEETEIFNTLFYIGSDGLLGKYQKQHLFSFWQEDKFFTPGNAFEPVSTPQGLLGGMICYDLRFPEVARAQAFKGAQLIVVAAEWPRVRVDHWQTLARARAVENQVFIIACNSCGTTGEHVLGGHSMVIGPDGTVLHEAGEQEQSHVVDLDANELTTIRTKFCPPGTRQRPIRDAAKCVELPALQEKLASIRQQQSIIAFTNGCFDILHSGHVAYLEKARSTADCLVVGLNSDSSVRAIKGDGRPVNEQDDRARILAGLACVDYVVIFNEETPQKLISTILPDVLVKGADWDESEIVGATEVKAAGGKVVRIEFDHNISTTAVIKRIQTQK